MAEDRFARTAQQIAQRQDARAAELAELVRWFVLPDGTERARDPQHARLLPDGDFRQLFEANRLALLRERRDVERRDLGGYLELAACEGPERDAALALAPHGSEFYNAELIWYLLERR